MATKGKELDSCADCEKFPCEKVSAFGNDGIPHHRQALENLMIINETGKENWFEGFMKNLECDCGERLSWYYQCPEHIIFLREWLAEEAAAFQGWDFSRLDGRMIEEPLPWDYREIVGQYLHADHKMLDMGTGGGEFLLSLNHPYQNVFVTEAYPPNVELCYKKLTPLGITVRQIADDDILPYDDAMFDIVLNRHESFDAQEVFRVLKPGGIYITQQVGGENNRALSELLIDDFAPTLTQHSLSVNQTLLQGAGFEIRQCGEYFPAVKFFDVGAVVYFAKIIEWEFPGFTVSECFNALLKLQRILEEQGCIESREHRFYLVCIKSSQ
jgi:SAM-dependent methyltransferase